MINQVYNFPEISFIGGETKKFLFTLMTERGTDFDASDCVAQFAIINYANKNGAPILLKDTEIVSGLNGVHNVVSVEIPAEDTLYLHGRFIYQIIVKDSKGKTEIPGQGVIDIIRNINPGFINA